MPVEREPLDPLPADYTPPEGEPYRVQDGDNWQRIADRVEMNVWDLIEYNFNTRSAAEVNWYLKRRVGCQLTTHDGVNWRFSSSATPGVIHLPKPVADRPVGAGTSLRRGQSLYVEVLRRGLSLDQVWESPDNAELKQVRKEPYLVRPDDRVTYPPITQKSVDLSTSRLHKFRYPSKPIPLGDFILYTDIRPGEPDFYAADVVLTGSGRFDYTCARRACLDTRRRAPFGQVWFVGLPKDGTFTLRIVNSQGEESLLFENTAFDELGNPTRELNPVAEAPR